MRSPLYEQALTKCGVKFNYVEAIALDEINQTRGKQMQARLQPLDLSLVDSYRQMLEDGFDPPPLVLWKPGRGLYVSLDGNQRIEAMRTATKKHQRPFSAYEIVTEDQMIVDRVCWQFNNMVNGRRLSYEENLEHALTFCRKYNQSTGKTAKDWGVKDWELRIRLREAELRDLAGSKKIDLSKVASKTVVNLAPLEKLGEDILLKAAKVVADTGVAPKDVERLVSDVSKARNHDDKIRVIDEFAASDLVTQTAAETKNGRIPKKQRAGLPRQQLQRQLDQLEKLLGTFDLRAFKPVGKEDRDEYSTKALWVANQFITIYGLGEYLKGQGVE